MQYLLFANARHMPKLPMYLCSAKIGNVLGFATDQYQIACQFAQASSMMGFVVDTTHEEPTACERGL
jgi:hypothetical protein